MDTQQVLQAISTLGFPIVMCALMAWFVKYLLDRNREQVFSIQESHTKEVEKITEALNNNTLALQKLCLKMEVSEDVARD